MGGGEGEGGWGVDGGGGMGRREGREMRAGCVSGFLK